MRFLPTLLLVASLLAGCDGDGFDDGYPPAGDFPSVSVADLATASPGRYNTTAYVSVIAHCPTGSYCLIPGSITLVQSLDADSPPLTLYLDDAGDLFETEERYEFSVEATGDEAGSAGALRLLGYSPR